MDSVSDGDHQPRCTTTTRDDFYRDSVIEKDLPDHLIYDILLRSPAESLLRFKIVCKDWYSLITDRDFVKQYDDHHKRNNDSMGIILMTVTTDSPNGYDLSNFNKLCCCDDHVGMQAEELALRLHMEEYYYPMRLTTCNGLVCFYRDFPLLMWNPVTKKSIMLSKPRIDEEKEYTNACGFGYDATNNVYKVVQLFFRRSDFSLECMVLNVGTNMSWSRIQHQDSVYHPNRNHPQDIPEPVFFDGSIYWRWTCQDILCFDVTSQTFKMVLAPAPEQRMQKRLDGHTKPYMVELDNNLCFVERYVTGGGGGRLMDIWIMRKDCSDMKTPWVMEYTIDLDCITSDTAYNEKINPVCIRSKKIYLNCNKGLACYDTETKEFDVVFTEVTDVNNYAVAYTKSIVRLQDIVGSKCVSTAHIGECEACRGSCLIVPRIYNQFYSQFRSL